MIARGQIMGKTVSEKIMSNHSGAEAKSGDIVIAEIDAMMGQDGTTPLAIEAFYEMGAERVACPEKIKLIIDHSSPSPLQGVSNLHEKMRKFSKQQGIHLYDIGEGVCHQLMLERGHVKPGNLVIGADSHTCTYGALGAFSTGVGSTDLAAAMMTGKLWFLVPKTILVKLNGKLPEGVYSKDFILRVAGDMTADGATYNAIEFSGKGIRHLTMDSRFAICNMAIEIGAKAGIIEPDEVTEAWLELIGIDEYEEVHSDDDAEYDRILEYEASDLEPAMAAPHTVDNLKTVAEAEGTPIQQAFLGTCTNGRLEDIAVAAKILNERSVSRDVRFIVAPASKIVFLEAMSRGYVKSLVEAGACFVTPGCGCCVGTHNGVPSDGETVISSANRNFKGRMGNNTASVYLASPATVAASAIEGKIADPRKYL